MNAVSVATKDNSSGTITIRHHFSTSMAHSKKMHRKFSEEMHKLARSMARGEKGINRPLLNALMGAFEYQSYEAFIFESPEAQAKKRNKDTAQFFDLPETGLPDLDDVLEKEDKNIVFFLMPPDFRLEKIIQTASGSVLSLVHDKDADFDILITMHKPHDKAQIILFRGDDGKLYIPHNQDYIPLNLTTQALMTVKGGLGKKLRKAHNEGLGILNKKGYGGGGNALRDRLRQNDGLQELTSLGGDLRPARKRRKTSSSVSALQVAVTECPDSIPGKLEPALSVRLAPVRTGGNSGTDTATATGQEKSRLYADQSRYRIIVENAARKAAKTLAEAAELEKQRKDLENIILHLEEIIILGPHPNKADLKKDETRLLLKQADLKKINKRIEPAWDAAFKADKRELEARVKLQEIEAQLAVYGNRSVHSKPLPASPSLTAKQLIRLRASYQVQQRLAEETDALVHRKTTQYADLEKAIAGLTGEITVLCKTEQPDYGKLSALRIALARKRTKASKIKKQADEIKERADFVANRLMITAKMLLPHREVLQSSALSGDISGDKVRKIEKKAAKIEKRCIESWCAAKGEQTRVKNGEARAAKARTRVESRRKAREASVEVTATRTAVPSERRKLSSRPALPAPKPPARRPERYKTHRPIGGSIIQARAAERRPWFARLSGSDHRL